MSDPKGAISRQAIKKVLDRVGKHKGVVGTVLCDSFGLSLLSSMSPDDAEAISAQVGSLVGKIKLATQEITGELSRSIRIETTNGDIEVIPDYETEITIVALVHRKAGM